MTLVINVGCYSSFGVFFKPILDEFGWDRATTSGAISFTLIMMGALGILLGYLTDRFGPRPVIIACGIISGFGYFLLSHLNSLWQLYIYYGFMIAAGMGIVASEMSTVTRWFSKNRSLMIGILVSSGGVGGMTMPLIVNWLIAGHGWRYSYVVLGILVLIINICAGMLLKRSPPSHNESLPADRKLARPSEGYSFKEVALSPYFWVIAAAYICFAFSSGTFQIHVVAHVIGLNYSSTTAASILSIMNGVNIVGCIVMGYIADRAGNRKLFVLTLLMAAIAVLGFVFIRQLGLLYAFSILYGFIWGASNAQQSPLVAGAYGVKALGILLGIITFAVALGCSLGGFLGGYVFDATGSYRLIFIINGILCGVGMLLMIFIKPPQSTSGS